MQSVIVFANINKINLLAFTNAVLLLVTPLIIYSVVDSEYPRSDKSVRLLKYWRPLLCVFEVSVKRIQIVSISCSHRAVISMTFSLS